MLGGKTGIEQHENAASYFEQILEATSHKTVTVLPLTSHQYKDEQNMLGTVGEVKVNSKVTFFNGRFLMDMLVLTDQHKPTFCADTRLFQEDLTKSHVR